MAEWEDDIKRYRSGEMTPAEQHAFEKKALNDPFLAEALEGAAQISTEEFSEDVKELHQKIEKRTKRSSWFWPLQIAATIAIIALSYVLFLSFFDKVTPSQESITLQSTESPAQPDKSENDINNTTAAEPKQSEAENKAKQEASGASTKEIITDKEKTVVAPIQTPKDELAISEANIENENKALDKKISESLKDEEQITAAQQAARVTKEESLKQEGAAKAYSLKSAADAASRVIHGKVIYAEDGKPLAGANVLVKGTRQGTVTDVNGEYTLTTTAAEPTLVYSFVGFQSTEVKAKDKSEVNVSLQSDVSQLSEVVVTGYNPQPSGAHEPVIKLAEPVGGRKAYDKYLQNSLRYPAQAVENKIKGKVTVQFTVRIDGTVDEFSILKGLGFGCDEEVIRLVKEGPHWRPTTEDDVPVESEVVVRVKFALPD
jgi:TonB family protein